tara:strand:+ start:352 stop:1197 length:846 start_codon:yes stop_codon:yes gene_type:complete
MSFKITPFMKKIGFKKSSKNNNFIKCSNNFNKKMPFFVINCAIHKERLNKFKKYSKKAKVDFCRINCVNGKKLNNDLIYKMYNHNPPIITQNDLTPIELSIYISHINTWLQILKSPYDYGIICEDDAEMRVNFKKDLNLVLEKLDENKIKFDILFLWNGNWNNTKSFLEQILKINKNINIKRETENFTAGTVCYIITKKFIRKILNKCLPIKTPIDVFLGNYYNKANILTIEMKKNKIKDCYISPFFRTGNWVCGGEWGAGNTTQIYEVPKIREILKNHIV